MRSLETAHIIEALELRADDLKRQAISRHMAGPRYVAARAMLRAEAVMRLELAARLRDGETLVIGGA